MKRFGSTVALRGVDLTVERATVLGVLGPNGAGKTTAVRILTTLLKPDAGGAWIDGIDVVKEPRRARARIGLTGQYAAVDERLTGHENLVHVGRLFHLGSREARSRADEMLERFDLVAAGSRISSTYSGGMRRRLDIAASIVITPELLFLDEPTTGLDPRSRNQVWEIIRILVAAGTTVVLTTQHLDEADQLADRIAIIDHGKVIAEGTPGQLKASVGSGTLRMRVRDPERRPDAQQVLSAQLGVPVHLESDPAGLSAQAPDPARVATALTALVEAGIDPAEFALGQPSLDEVFLALTGHPAEPTTEEDAA